MRELTGRKRGGDLADQLICDYALFHLEADLRWLELTAARLDDLPRRARCRGERAPRASQRDAGAGAAGGGRRQGVRADAGAGRGPADGRAGEIVAVMGPSGSGKSTLLHCAGRRSCGPTPARSATAGRTCRAGRPRAQRAAPARVRVRLPVRAAGAELTACRTSPCRCGWRRPAAAGRAAGPRWLDRLEVASAGRGPASVRRPAAARRGGAGAGHRPGGGLRGRADRGARLVQRRAGDGRAHRRRPARPAPRSCW